MLEGLAVRITLPFSDASGMVREWALKAERIVCYEHVGEATAKPHIHLLLLRVGCTKERLKQLAAPWVPFGSSGNEFWSFKSKSKELGPITMESSRRYIIYMTKGVNDPKYVKGFDTQYLEGCKEGWMVKEEETSRNEKLYGAFEDRVHEYWTADKLNEEEFQEGRTIIRVDKADVVERLARSWAFSTHKSIWSVRTATDAKMVYLTYCMRYGINIPKEVKTW